MTLTERNVSGLKYNTRVKGISGMVKTIPYRWCDMSDLVGYSVKACRQATAKARRIAGAPFGYIIPLVC